MNESQNVKTIVFGTLGAIATNATSTHVFDTWDDNGHPFHRAKVTVATAVATATNASAQWTSMVLLEGTVTNISSATAITTGTSGTASATQFVLPEHNDTAVKQLVVFEVDLVDKEQYLHVTIEAVTAAYSTVCFVAELSRAQIAPITAAERGAAVTVFV